MIPTYQIVVLAPFAAALLLVAIPGYRIGAIANVIASAVTFAAGLWLLVGGERGVGDYAIVDEFNMVFIVINTINNCLDVKDESITKMLHVHSTIIMVRRYQKYMWSISFIPHFYSNSNPSATISQ